MKTAAPVATAPHASAIKPKRMKRQSAEKRVKYVRVLVIVSLLAVVLGSAFFDSAQIKIKALWDEVTADHSGPIVHTAVISRPLLDGTFCRNTVFDAASSEMITEKVEFCDPRRQTSLTKPRQEFAWPGSR